MYDRALGRKRNKNKITKIFPKENEMILVRQLQPKRDRQRETHTRLLMALMRNKKFCCKHVWLMPF
jgi:hypothetical protein